MKYYISLFQRLKEIYLTQSGQVNEVALLCPSQRVYTNEELNLLVPQGLVEKENKSEAVYKKRDISYQLNSIPLSDTFWDINPNNSLFDRYREVLNNIKPKGLFQNLLDFDVDTNSVLFEKGKETKEYKAYKKYLFAVESAIENVEKHLELFSDNNAGDEKQNWLEKLNLLQNKTKLAFAELFVKGFKNKIEAEFEKISKKSEFDNYNQLLNSTKSIYKIVEKTDIETLSAYHDISFVPYDFMKSDSGWNKLKLSKAELEIDYEKAKIDLKNIPQEIISIDYDEKYITGIEFEYSFVHLHRAWFNTSIFESEFFGWEDQKTISNGETISNDYIISAFPKTMLLIKNLKVNIESNITDNQINNANQLIQFGPIIMKSQLFVNQSTNVKFVKAITNKETLLSNQLNYKLKKAEVSSLKIEVPVNNVEAPVIARNANFDNRRNISANNFSMAARIINKPTILNSTIHSPISIAVRPELITTISNSTIEPIKKAKVAIRLLNKITKEPIYQCEISIRGIDNNSMPEIETNQEGYIDYPLPFGTYKIECKKDGYKYFTTTFKVENTNELILEYTLDPDEVHFDSYFLIGMVCEKLPKC